MKNVKVFIASSAELDEDKLQITSTFRRRIRDIGNVPSASNSVPGVIFPATFLRSICRIDTMITFANVIL
ncbi:hypothetical protein NXX19_27200 [Bacteroides ovatus]|nr:hypothetical protein [Bacteroides ovatus]